MRKIKVIQISSPHPRRWQMSFTAEELQIIEEWLADPQIAYFSKRAAEVIGRLIEITSKKGGTR